MRRTGASTPQSSAVRREELDGDGDGINKEDAGDLGFCLSLEPLYTRHLYGCRMTALSNRSVVLTVAAVELHGEPGKVCVSLRAQGRRVYPPVHPPSTVPYPLSELGI